MIFAAAITLSQGFAAGIAAIAAILAAIMRSRRPKNGHRKTKIRVGDFFEVSHEEVESTSAKPSRKARRKAN